MKNLPIIKLHRKVWLVLSSQHNAQLIVDQLTCEVSVAPVGLVSFEQKGLAFRAMWHNELHMPLSLSEVYLFDGLMQRCSSKRCSVPLLVFAGTEPSQQVAIAFLVGCHLIMTHGLAFEEVVLALRPLQDKIDEFIGPLGSTAALRAMCCAKCLDWVDFHEDSDSGAPLKCPIDMDAYLHYSRHGTLL